MGCKSEQHEEKTAVLLIEKLRKALEAGLLELEGIANDEQPTVAAALSELCGELNAAAAVSAVVLTAAGAEAGEEEHAAGSERTADGKVWVQFVGEGGVAGEKKHAPPSPRFFLRRLFAGRSISHTF